MPILYVMDERDARADRPHTFQDAVEQVAATAAPDSAAEAPVVAPAPELADYFEVMEGCTHAFGGECINIRSGPGVQYPVVGHLRTGVVLRIGEAVQGEDRLWYRITFDEWVRYPERMSKKLYVAAEFVNKFQHSGPEILEGAAPTTTKRILVDRSDQKLYAYDGDVLFMEEHISTGNDETPTPRGNFKIFHKTPSRYMQGPVPGISDDEYDLPGVPWTMYFTKQGGAIHGAYWHDAFGNQHSHGCVNLPPDKAKILYEWADLGTPVTVRD